MDKGTVSACSETKENSGIFSLVISCENNQEVKPGQFIMLEPLAKGSEIFRPLSIYKITDNRIVVVFEVVGENTKAYSQSKPGDKIKIKGPLGCPIPIDAKAKRYILVGGGNGIAGLMFLSEELAQKSIYVDVLLGFKDESQIFGVNDFKNNLFRLGQVKVITENGPKPNGFVTKLLEAELENDNKESVVVACGPRPMLRKVAEMTKESGNECWVLLEEMMACGVGSGKCCAIFGVDGTVKLVCEDGPAFKASWVDWDKLVPEEIITPIRSSKKTDEPMKTVLRGQNGQELILEYPTMNGSGCLDLQAVESGVVDISRMGALVIKGTSLNPRPGNPTPRICETASGIINSIGIQNDGVDNFIKDKLPRWLDLDKPIIVNISGSSSSEFAEIAKRLVDNGVKIIEVNVSCPNVDGEGDAFGISAQATAQVTDSVRQSTPSGIIIIVKLTPQASDIASVAKAAVHAGADIISLTNTFKGMPIDPYTRKPKIGKGYGGVSGPGIRAQAVQRVYEVVSADLGVPNIGMGGINSAETATEFLMVGAQAFGIGTGLLVNPNIFTEIYNPLLDIMKFHQVNHIQDLVGTVIMPKE